MQRWMIKLYPVAVGGVTLGWLQAVSGIGWNQVWFQFLATWLSALVAVLFGGNLSDLPSNLGSSSPFGSLFG